MQTMSQALNSLIDKFGLAEVLDRLASYSYEQSRVADEQQDHWNVVTKLLEEAVEAALIVQSEK